jgi:hypothetical protein
MGLSITNSFLVVGSYVVIAEAAAGLAYGVISKK